MKERLSYPNCAQKTYWLKNMQVNYLQFSARNFEVHLPPSPFHGRNAGHYFQIGTQRPGAVLVALWCEDVDGGLDDVGGSNSYAWANWQTSIRAIAYKNGLLHFFMKAGKTHHRKYLYRKQNWCFVTDGKSPNMVMNSPPPLGVVVKRDTQPPVEQTVVNPPRALASSSQGHDKPPIVQIICPDCW